ncbi:MAG: response regulator transcription factor [Acidobacteria bacterium]|nr:response regulator transcription factor [Acidobacteriota bacterium]
MNKTRVLIVDDEILFLDLMARTLKMIEGIDLIGTASSGREAIQIALEANPDIILMDVDMCDINGIEATRRIMSDLPDTRIIALSGHEDRGFVEQMFKAGAMGYVLKNSKLEEVVTAIQSVSDHKNYISPSIARTLIDSYIRQPSKQQVITEREKQILQLLDHGKRMKEIALELNISVKTAYTHRQNLMKKLGADTVVQLIKLGREKGILYMG